MKSLDEICCDTDYLIWEIGKIWSLVMLENTLLAHSIFIISSFFLWYLNTKKIVTASNWLREDFVRTAKVGVKLQENDFPVHPWLLSEDGVKSTSVCCPWIPHWVSPQSVSLMSPTQQLPLQIVLTLSFNCQSEYSTFSSSSSSAFRISAYDFRRTGSWKEKFKFTA